jgi:membrane protease YdiL (CAAX protease family)
MRSFTSRERKNLMSLSFFFQGMILALIAINSIHGGIYFYSTDSPLSLLTRGVILAGIILVFVIAILYAINFVTFVTDEKKPVKILFFALGIASGFFGKELTYLFLPITFFLMMCALFHNQEASGSEENLISAFLSIVVLLAICIAFNKSTSEE